MHLSLTQIRTLPRDTVEQALVIEQACQNALLLRPKTMVEHAELLFLYAEAMAFTRERRFDASPFAYRAYRLAFEAKDYVLAMKARCLNVYCNARNLLLTQFWSDVITLRMRVNTSWIPDLCLTKDQISEIHGRITALEEYGDRLAEERKLARSA